MNRERRHTLINRYQEGTASPAEIDELSAWYQNISDGEGVFPEEESVVRNRMLNRLDREIKVHSKARARFYRVAAAAAILMAIAAIFFFDRPVAEDSLELQSAGIKPGSNKAQLTLSNGKTIDLSDAAEGKLHTQAGLSITKTAEGLVVYQVSQDQNNRHIGPEPMVNTIATPRGGQYQVILPDGTKVWLNAATLIRFPQVFPEKGARNVELNGEAYFEVKKDAEHPFTVQAGEQRLEVLGTHFNLSAYADESAIKTTLLEGSVQISAQAGLALLKPGQQSVLREGALQVRQADLDQAIAWKNAMFVFDHDNLESIMKKISRWYDVEIVYRDQMVKMEMFSGRVSRSEDVAEVLHKLMLTDAVKFKIEGRRIVVMK